VFVFEAVKEVAGGWVCCEFLEQEQAKLFFYGCHFCHGHAHFYGDGAAAHALYEAAGFIVRFWGCGGHEW
jgi:hypothetical protein